MGWLSVGLWYNVINQFMIQNVLAAKNMYHARMGIVLAGFIKILMPAIVVIPGLIMFANSPDIMMLPFDKIREQADKGYVHLLHTLIPAGFRGLFLAALFGAIQSHITSVLNSTSTMFTMDIYKRWIRRDAPDRHYVVVGVGATACILLVSIVLGRYIGSLGGGLFVYIQTLYAFLAPPFAAVFLLGVLFKRINGAGACTAVVAGFVFSTLIKVYIGLVPNHPAWLDPYAIQAFCNWLLCVAVCVVVSLATPPPRPDQIGDDMTINWRKLNITRDLGERWYQSVVFWWVLFVIGILCLVITFSGRWQ